MQTGLSLRRTVSVLAFMMVAAAFAVAALTPSAPLFAG